jgi:hypothetical protein
VRGHLCLSNTDSCFCFVLQKEHNISIFILFSGEEENILNALQNVSFLNVYKKGGDELKKLHYSSSERIAPIVLTGSQEGVIIFPDKNSQDSYDSCE